MAWKTVSCLLLVYLIEASVGTSQDRRGPVFTYEPPSSVEFSNSTGTVIPCSAEGIPAPSIRWTHALDGSFITDIPGLRHVRPDGSLVFPPFRGEDQRPDVHTTTYRCVASNAVGAIGSRDVSVKGDLRSPCLLSRRTEKP
ncbi:Down syndrome cell adhesion molecule-like protein Dscam2 [Stegodyphus dumicola]|uniref:Down syndrome cell adhesion molecule-like protein Dscam2 n=1 Tax=Stegodyphus dumicola TaxID=202533 RepID=UPI0015A7AB6C|nr:Down syndrome cell adhesion molecule-like protein Dscam2 [Stegodyphus dumicola]